MKKTYQTPAIRLSEMQLECALNTGTTAGVNPTPVNPENAGAKGNMEWEEYLKED